MMGDNHLMGSVTFCHGFLDECQTFLMLRYKVISREEGIVVADLTEIVHATEYMEFVLRIDP